MRLAPPALVAASLVLVVLPAPHAAAAGRCAVTPAPGTTVMPSTSQQVMVAHRTSGTRGTWRRYEWRGTSGGCWVRVDGSSVARFGYGGVVPASRRQQDTGTTPAGTFPIPFVFGEGNPGTRMPYRVITSRSVWVNNPDLPDYNRWRSNGTATGDGIGEDLSDFRDRGFYRQAAVIGYNYDRPVRHGRGSGAGIFLHFSRVATAGCVGLENRTELNRTIAWLDPSRHPVIVISG